MRIFSSLFIKSYLYMYEYPLKIVFNFNFLLKLVNLYNFKCQLVTYASCKKEQMYFSLFLN